MSSSTRRVRGKWQEHGSDPAERPSLGRLAKQDQRDRRALDNGLAAGALWRPRCSLCSFALSLMQRNGYARA